MPKRISLNSRGADAAILGAGPDVRDDELLDAIATVGALIACADGRIDPVERAALADFTERNGFLSSFKREEVLAAFERRLRQFKESGAAGDAVDRLERFAGRAPARLLIDASRQVATADGRLHAREIHFLQLIHIALVAPFSQAPSYSESAA